MEKDLKNVNNKTDGTSADDQKGELYSRTHSHGLQDDMQACM